jgi:amylosucrase
LEAALHSGNPAEIDLAVRRILLLNAIILSIGGVPLIYLGDEIGILNDYSYVEDAAKAGDSRWVHRPRIDWEQMARRLDQTSIEGRIYTALRRLIELRKATKAFAGNDMRVINLGNDHVFAYVRSGRQSERVLVLANFSEHTQPIAANEVRLYGLSYHFRDLITGQELKLGDDPIVLAPYQVLWLAD